MRSKRGEKYKAGRVLGKSWQRYSEGSIPVPCGVLTVIGVSTLPQQRRLIAMRKTL